MKMIAWCLPLVFLMAACASTTDVDQEQMQHLYSKYNSHCQEHARQITGEADEEARYEECMTYFIQTDVHCPICDLEPNLTKAKK